MEGLRTTSGSGVRRLRGGPTGERPRMPGVAYAVLTLALVTLVGALALTSRQTAPPTIAEFAPQAVEQIMQPQAGLTGSRRTESAGVCDTQGDCEIETPSTT